MSHIVIAGASGAIGTALVRKYLDEGHVVTALINRSYLEFGHKHLHERLINTDEIDVPQKVDALITLTADTRNKKLGKMDINEWESVLRSTLTSPFQCINALASTLVTGASIVVVGSIVGSLGGYGCANYAAAKAGLVGLVRAAANELAGRKIRVNLLELGYVNAGMGERLSDDIKAKVTETIPLKRFAEVDEVLHAIEFLRTATYMTGNTLTVAGGLRA